MTIRSRGVRHRRVRACLRSPSQKRSRPLCRRGYGPLVAWREKRLAKRGGGLGKPRAQAEVLKRDLLASARYLLRKDEGVQARLDDIAAGDGLPDLIDDLTRLARLVDEHPAVFTSYNKLPKSAGESARILAETLTNGADSTEANLAQTKRNLLAHALEDAIQEVRAAAHFLFRDEPKKLAPYLSRYGIARKQRSLAAKKDLKAPVTPTTTPA